jgi:ferric-dicitrate binding protein FerR (iron transport regulator)
MTNGNNDSVNELITKHLAGEASAEEKKDLFAWTDAHAENKRHYDALKKAFDLTQRHFGSASPPHVNIDIDAEWDRFTETVGESKSRKMSPSMLWLRIAATVLLLMATGGILYHYSAHKTLRYETAGNTQIIALPDGSQVTLNRHTLLSYDRDFGTRNRTVSLEGEVFFEVKPDAKRPFIILTQNTRVQVVGTSFNVNAYDSLNEVEVIVKTGIVSFGATAGSEKVQLVAGQKGVYSKATEKVASTANDDVNFLSWNTRRLVFVESDLRSVVESLKKTYRAEIVIDTDIPVTCSVTVTFDHQSLESVLRVLESTLNLKYTVDGNKIVITEAGC